MIKTLNSLLHSEQKYIFAYSLIFGLFSALDLTIDLNRGVNLFHIFFEGSAILISAGILMKLINSERSRSREILVKFTNLEQESFLLREDIKKYKDASQLYVTGISDLIDKQFTDWDLSKSEKDVALLLLKGLSHKEIAQIRNTAEKTVRRQAGIVYSKAKLEGRAQLSAFFLEDILNTTK